MLARWDEHRDPLALQRQFAVKDGGDGGGSGALGQGLFALQQQEDRVRDFFLFDRDDVIDVLLNKREGAFSGAADGNSVGNCLGGLQSDRLALGDSSLHGRNAGGLYSENLYSGICFFDGAGDAADEASSTNGRNDDFDAGMLLQDFQAESSLPCDDGVVIEGMNQGEAVLLALRDSLFVGLVVIRTVQHDFGAVGARCRDFGERSRQRHYDASFDFVASGVVGDALRVIAGGCGDHSTGPFIPIEGEELVQSAALFERSGALLVIELEENGIVGETGERFRVGAGRDADVRANSVEGGLDVRKLDHDGDGVILLYPQVASWIADSP